MGCNGEGVAFGLERGLFVLKGRPLSLKCLIGVGLGMLQRQAPQLPRNFPHRVWGIRQRKARLLRLQSLAERSEEHTSELQSLMRISYAVFCLKKKTETS